MRIYTGHGQFHMAHNVVDILCGLGASPSKILIKMDPALARYEQQLRRFGERQLAIETAAFNFKALDLDTLPVTSDAKRPEPSWSIEDMAATHVSGLETSVLDIYRCLFGQRSCVPNAVEKGLGCLSVSEPSKIVSHGRQTTREPRNNGHVAPTRRYQLELGTP